MILAGNNICQILLFIVLETKIQRTEDFFCNNSLYRKLANLCFHKAQMPLSNPCSPDNQRKTEGEFWLSELKLGPALTNSTDILSVGRKGIPGMILNNDTNNNSSCCLSLLLCHLFPDQLLGWWSRTFTYLFLIISIKWEKHLLLKWGCDQSFSALSYQSDSMLWRYLWVCPHRPAPSVWSREETFVIIPSNMLPY